MKTIDTYQTVRDKMRLEHLTRASLFDDEQLMKLVTGISYHVDPRQLENEIYKIEKEK